MFDYDLDSKRAVEKLDEYDFTDILSECYDMGMRDPYDIGDCISEDYPELEDTIADLTGCEWMEYLTARYPVRFEEISHYRMWYTRPN